MTDVPETESAKRGYEFAIWPAEHGWEPAVYETFRNVPRIGMNMTEEQWTNYQAQMERSGFTLREVENYQPDCVCGHPESDHYLGGHWQQFGCAAEGCAESCSCREFRP